MPGSTSSDPAALLREGRYLHVLGSDAAKTLIARFVRELQQDAPPATPSPAGREQQDALYIALAAFNAFLQANVTGPVLEGAENVERAFEEGWQAAGATKSLRKKCFRVLDVDGVSVYPYIPHIELFAFARWLVVEGNLDGSVMGEKQEGDDGVMWNASWLALRIQVWHFKLLSQPSFGSGSVFVKGGHWSDVPALQQEIERALGEVEKCVMEGGGWKEKEKVKFLVEKANICIMLGQDVKAREALQEARERNGFVYALSGALGKRTKFQEKSTSHLIVLAKSEGGSGVDGEGVKPEALKLNDDTLLENLEFTKEENAKDPDHKTVRDLPDALRGLEVDDQPQLAPVDQIILLTEATLKDAFSPTDTLTSEEILPFAVRVISDKATNWQIYTQALLVRSRIEVHRSRTVERGVLQMQAVVDQVVVETTAEGESKSVEEKVEGADIPVIKVNNEEAKPVEKKPTSFFPAAKPTETAPAQVRLQYIHTLSCPPRWHLESELAYSWASVGSLVSALEIFKRLHMWAEVALCLASAARTEDEDGRGSGGEAKAKGVLRWRLFHRTGHTEAQQSDDVDEDVDVEDLKEADFQGPERSPPPPNAPRLFCILGDIENSRAYYERAWEVSNHRFFRAQKSLGECYLQDKDLVKAKEAYEKAVAVNRMSSELWNRLGDISLRLGQFSDAATAFGRAISVADNIVGGEDARTWSNLGSALYSLYVERVKELKLKKDQGETAPTTEAEPSSDLDTEEPSPKNSDPSTLLSQSLAAYKKGASISHDNWRIWDNVITLASRLRPVAVPEILLALRNIIRIRNTEDALDIDVLRLLLNDSVLSQTKADDKPGVYDPPRGSTERAVCDVIETLVVPLITVRSELWELVTRERVWRRDYAGAIEAAERAWRAAVGAAVGGGLLPSSGTGGDGARKNWLEDKGEWKIVVDRTDELVSVLENYGDLVEEIGAKWKGKARSAVRSVMGKAKESWEGSDEWEALKTLLDGLR